MENKERFLVSIKEASVPIMCEITTAIGNYCKKNYPQHKVFIRNSLDNHFEYFLIKKE